MASLVVEEETSKAPLTTATVAVVIAAAEIWEAVKEAVRDLGLREVMEHRDIRNWPLLIERLQFLRPLPLEEAVRGIREALPQVMLVARDVAAQSETILVATRGRANEFCTRRPVTISGKAIARRAQAPLGRRNVAGHRARCSDFFRRKAVVALRLSPVTWRRNWGVSARSGPSAVCSPIWTCNPELWASL
jgi:hypothetical protein